MHGALRMMIVASTRLRRIAAIALLVAAWPALAIALDASALWSVVRYCSLQNRAIGLPFPCLDVREDGNGNGYALIRSPGFRSEILLVPTTRITGVEDPRAASPKAALFWRRAWEARDLVARGLGRPLGWRDLGLVVNAKPSRTQDQLHIHIDCVKASIAARIASEAARLGDGWSREPSVEGMAMWARRFGEHDLGRVNPLAAVFDGIPEAREDPAAFGVAVIGATLGGGARGFVLVALRSSRTTGSAETLLDHSCSRGRSVTPAMD
jgi:CDP-diacylglycerol pyrophosphatase